MANFKFKIIFLNIALFFSFSVQAHECQGYFKKSDFAQSHSLSMENFELLESLVKREISAHHIENVILRTDELEEVSTKLIEIAQAGIPIKAYQKVKEFVLKDMKQRKERKEKILHEQKQQLIDSRIDGRKAVFHRIEPGSFLMGRPDLQQVPTTITQPFELMATLTTQIIWKEVAQLINTKLQNKHKIFLAGFANKGDTRPVENMPEDQIQMWIDGLNVLSQLGEPALLNLIEGHKMGDTYRLPTEAEWEFVIRGRGEYNETYHFGNKASELGEHAWFQDNSNYQTHPVAQKKPLVVDGNKEFFDMHGNVSELMADRWDGRSGLLGGVDPIGKEGRYHIIRGGNWRSFGVFLGSDGRGMLDSNRPAEEGTEYVGFRLLRILNSP